MLSAASNRHHAFDDKLPPSSGLDNTGVPCISKISAPIRGLEANGKARFVPSAEKIRLIIDGDHLNGEADDGPK
jgi:hypothetical protein